MTRRHIQFEYAGDGLVGTLDEGTETTGLLIVTGGNEIRCGAFSGQALLAQRISQAGFPVFRFDRRGIGDSSGENFGFRDSGPDIAAAAETFRSQCPGLSRVIGFGNCDAASALMLNSGAGCDGLILSNPWTIEEDDGSPPPQAIRERYAQKLRDPKELVRLVTGKVSFRKLASGLRRAAGPAAAPTTLAAEVRAGLEGFSGPVAILLAERDRTAQAFMAAWDKNDPRLAKCPGASHAYVESEAREWLFRKVLAAVQG